MNDWNEVTVRLRYRDGALTPGGESRCEPSSIKELVEEIDRAMNASHFGGQIELSLESSEDTYPVVEPTKAVAAAREFLIENASKPNFDDLVVSWLEGDGDLSSLAGAARELREDSKCEVSKIFERLKQLLLDSH